jgi:hypothetical protein
LNNGGCATKILNKNFVIFTDFHKSNEAFL